MPKPNSDITQAMLDELNVEQEKKENKQRLIQMGGVELLLSLLKVNVVSGLTTDQVQEMRRTFGTNTFPESPMEGFFSIFFGSFNDFTLLVLIAAALVSLGIGIYQEPDTGWIEGAAILIAVFLVGIVTATNDYTKELQFRKLESSSQSSERTSVIRNGVVERINPIDVVVGDILKLQVSNLLSNFNININYYHLIFLLFLL